MTSSSGFFINSWWTVEALGWAESCADLHCVARNADAERTKVTFGDELAGG